MSRIDPWLELGLEPDADDGAIEAAHRSVVARLEQAGDLAGLARVATAYAIVKDPRARARERLFGPPPIAALEDLAAVLRALPRIPAGATLWLDALREGR